jgi:hypothetical protein
MAAGTEGAPAPDFSGASGPLDPWGGARYGEPVGEAARAGSGPLREPLPEPLFRGAPLGAGFHGPDGPDLPPAASREAEVNDDDDEAWLRETSAHFSMNARPPAEPAPVDPGDAIADARTVATPAPPQPAPRRRPTLASSFAPPPTAPAQAPASPLWPGADIPSAQPARPSTPRLPDLPPAYPAAAPRWDAAPPPRESGAPGELESADWIEDEGAGEGVGEAGFEGEQEEELAPWREAGWRPPILPRFGPPDEPPGAPQPPRRTDRRTDR